MIPLKPLLITLLLGLAHTAAANPGNSAEISDDLKEIKQAIQSTQNDLQQKQSAQKSTRANLNRTQSALKQAKQELDNINRRQRDAWAKLQKLQNELGRLKTETAATKAQIARLLAGNYKNRQPNAVMLFLKNAEPGQKNRYLEYSRHINAANEKVINSLIQQQEELDRQEKAIDAELARLNQIKQQKQAALKKLGQANSSALAESNRLSAQIDKQTRQLANLRENEQKLNRLLAEIARKNEEKRKKAAIERKKAAEARLAAAKAQKESGKKTNKNEARKQDKPTKQTATAQRRPKSTLTAEDMALQAPSADTQNRNSFGNMQGRLKRPVGGSITGRFGQPRPSGGTWRGTFFSTAPTGVRSIADGNVAYTTHLGGYGNVVIIDHGDTYMSVYAGLNSINVSNGSRVKAGQTLGTSGSLPGGEQGLYLEIRYRNQALNPLSWIL